MTVEPYTSAVLVIGMHRSGTSALARALMLLGGDVPEQLLEPSPNNERGFWESPVINALDNSLLAARGATWHSVTPLADRPTDTSELAAIRAAVASQFGTAERPVMKDPRICRLANVWIEALRDCANDLVFPFILRNPVEIAASLTARNQFSTELGLLLGARYNLDAEFLTRGRMRGIITYDGLVSDWRGAISRLEKQIGSPLVTPTADEAGVDAFLSPDLHRQRFSADETEAALANYPIVRDVWDEFREWARKGQLSAAAGKRLDRLRGDLDRLGPLANTILEDNRILEKRQSEAKRRQESEVQRALEAHGAGAASQKDAIAALEVRLGEMLRLSDKRLRAKLEEWRNQDANAETERAALRAQLDARGGEIDSLRRALAEEEAARTLLRERIGQMQEAMDEREALNAHKLELRAEQIDDLKASRLGDQALLQERAVELAEAHAALDAAKAGHQAELERLNGQLADIRLQLDAAQSREVELAEEVSSLGLARDDAARQVQDKAQALAQLAVEHDLVLATTTDVRAELKDVTRKYRSTQATLARTKSALDIARAQAQAADAQRMEREAELQRLSALWHIRAAQWLLTFVTRLFAGVRWKRRNPRQPFAMVAASGLFDGAWYLDRYRDVARSGSDPLAHYMTNGWRENRDPGPDFSVSRYLRENPDVAAAGINPLLHYVEFGQSEGRGTRKSKLAGEPPAQTISFPPPAPVFSPSALPPPAVVSASEGTAVAFDGDLAALEALCGDAPAALARIARFKTFFSHPDDAEAVQPDQEAEGWPGEAWFLDDHAVRILADLPGAVIVQAFQNIAGTIHPLRVVADGEGTLADIALVSAYHPLLLVLRDPKANLVPLPLAFPSLLRGGLHHPEFLDAIAGLDKVGTNAIATLSNTLESRLAAIRRGTARPLVARVSVETAGATGTGQLFEPAFRAWLRDMFDIALGAQPVADDAPPRHPGEAYLAEVVAQQGSRSEGAALVLPADMVPTLSILCAHGDAAGGCIGETAIGLPHMMVTHDESQPGLVVLAPPIALDVPASAVVAHGQRQAYLTGARALRRRPNAAALSRVRSVAIADAAMLFPVAASLPLTAFEPAGIRLVVAANEIDQTELARTCEALAMQSCAAILEIAFIGSPAPNVLDRATALFPKRHSIHQDWAAALAGCVQPLCGTIAPGTVLHDWRTLAVLAEFAYDKAATASCPLVTSTRAGKGWATRIVDNGLVAERPGDAYAEARIRTDTVLWGGTYPVRMPSAGLWLSRTDKLRRWTREDTHRLARADGAHWCIGLTTASVANDLALRPPLFEPPIADPACFTMVRMLKG